MNAPSYSSHRRASSDLASDAIITLEAARAGGIPRGPRQRQTVKTAKVKKIAKPFVKAEATKEHPAQVEVVHDDVVTGYWQTVKLSGALPATRVAELRDRVERLQQAVKFAREQANLQEAPQQKIGEKVLGYLFA